MNDDDFFAQNRTVVPNSYKASDTAEGEDTRQSMKRAEGRLSIKESRLSIKINQHMVTGYLA